MQLHALSVLVQFLAPFIQVGHLLCSCFRSRVRRVTERYNEHQFYDYSLHCRSHLSICPASTLVPYRICVFLNSNLSYLPQTLIKKGKVMEELHHALQR